MVYKHLVLGCDDDVCMHAGQYVDLTVCIVLVSL